MLNSKIPIIYVAGPYRAANADGIQRNIDKARAVGLRLPAFGWIPLIPHSNLAHFDSDCPLPDEFWLDGTMELMRRCDAVLMMDGWESSSGAIAERDEALRLGMQVFTVDNWPPLASDFLASLTCGG